MSIYATLWELRLPELGYAYPGCSWAHVLVQAVPDFVNPPQFLPTEVGVVSGRAYSAVVIVTSASQKGTSEHPQQYVDPLLVMSGAEFAGSSFEGVLQRIADALRGEQPRVISYAYPREMPDTVRLTFEDGSTRDVPRERET